MEVFLCQLVEEVGITDRREDVMCLHPLIAVVGAQLQKFQKIAVPRIQVDGGRTGAHA